MPPRRAWTSCRSASITRPTRGRVIVPASSSITSLADLAGKNIGIPGEYGSSYYATLAAIKAGGLQTSDVTISSIGYTQQAALAAGQVDAVVGFTNNDAVQMRLAGIDIREIPLDGASTPLVAASIITTREWAQAHPDAGTRGRVRNHRGDERDRGRSSGRD